MQTHENADCPPPLTATQIGSKTVKNREKEPSIKKGLRVLVIEFLSQHGAPFISPTSLCMLFGQMWLGE